MTPEAVLAGLRRLGGESRGMPPLDAIQKHLGADAAIWNCIKAGGVLESNAAETKAARERSSVPAATVVPDNLGFVAQSGWSTSSCGLTALAGGRKESSGEHGKGGRFWFAPVPHAESNRSSGGSRCFLFANSGSATSPFGGWAAP
jgi:hypothetical protein